MADELAPSSDERFLNGTSSGNFSEDDVAECVRSYLPTVQEAREGLGAYGLTLVIIGSITTIVLYVLFCEQFIFTLRNVHKVFRRHIYWITSIYPFMTLMSVVAVVMPRSAMIASGIKTLYMCIGLSHFVDLTELMFGSERVMLAKLQGARYTISTGPLCCVFPCLPTIKITQNRMRIIKWMVWQMPYMQAIYFGAQILWSIADSDENGFMNPSRSYLVILLLNMLSFICGVWALNILSVTVREQLQHYGYAGKSTVVRLCIIVTKLQSFILDFLALFGVYPCLGPIITGRVFKIIIEQSLYLLEMIILGPLTYKQYRTKAFSTRNSPDLSEIEGTQDQSVSPGVLSEKLPPLEDHNSTILTIPTTNPSTSAGSHES